MTSGRMEILFAPWVTQQNLSPPQLDNIFIGFRTSLIEAGHPVAADPDDDYHGADGDYHVGNVHPGAGHPDDGQNEGAWGLVNQLGWAPANDELINRETAIQRLDTFTDAERRDLAAWLRQKADELGEDPKLAEISKADRMQMAAQGREMFDFLRQDSSLADYLVGVLQDVDLDSLLEE